MKRGFIRWMGSRVGGVWDETRRSISSVWNSFSSGVSGFFRGRGGIPRMIVDVAIATCLAIWVIPLVVIALAAASFIDTADTMTALVTGLLAFLALEVLALWAMEIIVVLAAFQVARLTTRYLHYVELRQLKWDSSHSSEVYRVPVNQH